MYFVFIGVFLLSIGLVHIVIFNAPKWGLMDIPNERSAHKVHTPRGAGIGFYFAVALILPIFYFQLLAEHWQMLLAVFLVFLIGILDDHRDAAPKTKFVVLAISTIILYFDDIYINEVGNYFGIPISLGWLALPFTIFAVIGFTNALNLIDGLYCDTECIFLYWFCPSRSFYDDIFRCIYCSTFWFFDLQLESGINIYGG